MSKTPNATPLLQWEIEEARYLRETGNSWRTIGRILDRDASGLRRAVSRRLIHKTRGTLRLYRAAAE